MIEPLTPCELEVLSILRGLSRIKESAKQLYLAHSSAWRHTINTYVILGVSQHWKAVAQAADVHCSPGLMLDWPAHEN